MLRSFVAGIMMLVLFGLTTEHARAQVDTEFWFAAPFVAEQNPQNFNLPIYLRFSSYSAAVTVTISQPASGGSFTPITFNMAAGATQTIDLSAYVNQIVNTPPDQVLNRGLLISATGDISVYYEVASTYCNCNPELYALKGRNALGTNFLLSYQNLYVNSQTYNPLPSSTFEIVASENNTTVTITPTQPLIGHPAGTTFNITLNRGQTWSGRAVGFNGPDHPNGTIVTSDKPIAITLSDDLVRPTWGSCADLMGDQTVPVDRIGNEYIVQRGGLSAAEAVFILGTQNNTQIFVDGNPVPVATINAGQTHIQNLSNPSMYINASAPVYVLHVSGFGCELGEALLPSIECTGSEVINVFRTTSSTFSINVLTRAANQNSFTINGSGALIPGSAFTAVPGTGGQWVSAQLTFSTAQVPVGGVVSVANSMGLFHLGLINGSPSGGCNYGYFSNYGRPELLADDTTRFCFGDTFTLTTTSNWDSIWWTDLVTSDTLSRDTFLLGDTDSRILLITELAGCINYDTITVLERDSITMQLTFQPATCNASDGSISVDTAFNYVGNYTLELNGSPGSSPFLNLPAGIYTVSLTDSLGCSGTLDTLLTSTLGNLSIRIDSAGQPLCSFTDSSGHIAYTVLGGVGPYSVYLNNALVSNTGQDDLDSIPRGIYTLRVVDGIGCEATWDTAFTIAGQQPRSLLPDSMLFCWGLYAGVYVGPQVWDSVRWFLISDNSTVGTTNSQPHVDSTVTLGVETWYSQCYYRDTIRVIELQEVAFTVQTTPVTCFDDSSGTVDITVTASNGPIIDYIFDSYFQPPPYTNLPVGSYEIIVMDQRGCMQTDTAVVLHVDTPRISITHISFTDCGYGDITFNVTGGMQPYSVDWNGTNLGNITGATMDSLVPGIYSILVVDVNGCNVQVDTVLLAPPFTNIDILAPDTVAFCNGGSRLLDAGATWDSTAWLLNGQFLANSQTWLADTSGTFVVTTTSGTCQYWDSVVVVEATPVVATAQPQYPSCHGDSDGFITAGASGGNGPYTYSLNNVPGSSPFTGLGAGNYTLIAMDANGCADTVTTTLLEPTLVSLTLDMVAPIGCNDSVGMLAYTFSGDVRPETALLNGFSAPADWQYTISGLPAGSYTLEVTDSNGCSATIDTVIGQTVFTLGALTVTDITCFGDQNDGADLEVEVGEPPYQYYLNGVSATLPANNLGSGSYTVSVVDANGCGDSVSFTITEPVAFEIDMDSLLTIFEGQAVALTNQPTLQPVSWQWQPATGLDCDDCAEPVAEPDSTTYYTLTAQTANGCVATASVMVEVLGHAVYIPNAFTPNNDGLNDLFKVYGQGFETLELLIFDRWGEVIFRSNDQNIGWNGTFKGQPLMPGPYVYMVKYRFYGGYDKLEKGSVLLMR